MARRGGYGFYYLAAVILRRATAASWVVRGTVVEAGVLPVRDYLPWLLDADIGEVDSEFHAGL